MTMPRAFIFANGQLSHPALTRRSLHPADALIAADGGARHLRRLGLLPAIILGDFDSLSAEETAWFEQQGVSLRRFPPAKDQTDLELALEYALQAGYSPIRIVSALGGRLDQTLGNLALLASPACLQADVRLDDGQTEAFFITENARLQGRPGDTLSLLPWGQPAEGITTQGLLYPLKDETLTPWRSRGISNQMLSASAEIHLRSGLLLCVHQRRNPPRTAAFRR